MDIPKDFINALAVDMATTDFTDLVKFYEAIGNEDAAKRFEQLTQTAKQGYDLNLTMEIIMGCKKGGKRPVKK